MKPILSHISALEYWRSVRVESRSFAKVSDPAPLLLESPTAKALDQPGPWWLARPLHVLVGENDVRRESSQVTSHVWRKALPEGSVLDTTNGFCVCSPEFTFVLMATILELPKLIELGFELCGTYAISDDALRECMPLTSVEKLTAFAVAANGVYGRKRAMRALKYVAAGSASPRETILTMLLCLPCAMGGYGIDMPELNFRVDLRGSARKITDRAYCSCDLCWPKVKLAAEYDGEEFHTGLERVAKDSMRRDALIAMGFTVITVTKWQIGSGKDMNGIAHVIAGRTGKRLRYKDPEFTRASIELRKVLLGRA